MNLLIWMFSILLLMMKTKGYLVFIGLAFIHGLLRFKIKHTGNAVDNNRVLLLDYFFLILLCTSGGLFILLDYYYISNSILICVISIYTMCIMLISFIIRIQKPVIKSSVNIFAFVAIVIALTQLNSYAIEEFLLRHIGNLISGSFLLLSLVFIALLQSKIMSYKKIKFAVPLGMFVVLLVVSFLYNAASYSLSNIGYSSNNVYFDYPKTYNVVERANDIIISSTVNENVEVDEILLIEDLKTVNDQTIEDYITSLLLEFKNNHEEYEFIKKKVDSDNYYIEYKIMNSSNNVVLLRQYYKKVNERYIGIYCVTGEDHSMEVIKAHKTIINSFESYDMLE